MISFIIFFASVLSIPVIFLSVKIILFVFNHNKNKTLEHTTNHNLYEYDSKDTLASYKIFIKKEKNQRLLDTVDKEVNSLLWTI